MPHGGDSMGTGEGVEEGGVSVGVRLTLSSFRVGNWRG